MGVRLGVVRTQSEGLASLAVRSRASLDVALTYPAELSVAIAEQHGVLLGAFQRTGDLAAAGPLRRRGSGGPELRVAPGSVHVLLSLASPAALLACDERRIVNRYVRPLLRALTRTGHLAHYFGRDWVSVSGRPVAWVGFAHDAQSRRTAFEALVAIGAPYVVRPRESLRGKEAAVLDIDPGRLADAIADAYAHDVERVEIPRSAAPIAAADEVPSSDPAWAATRDEVIGTIGAGRDAMDVFRVGGDLLVSRDALARLEAAAPAAGDTLGALIDRTLAAPGIALEGVRSLANVRDCVSEALAAYG